jgi:hypothetical protein
MNSSLRTDIDSAIVALGTWEPRTRWLIKTKRP